MQDRFQTSAFVCGTHRFEIGWYSDIGDRPTQEDSYYISTHDGVLLTSVCDGMGGHRGGAIASRTAIGYLHAAFQAAPYRDAEMYERLLDELDAKVYYLKDEEGNPLSAGTTIVSVIIDGNQLSWLSIGDSRLYLIRENQIVQVTRDHNYLEALRDLLQNGKITQEQFLAEREKHAALTSYLGIGGVHQYDISAKPFCLNNGDLLVLATDGMYHSVDMQAFLPLCRAELPFMMQQLDAAIRADMQIIRDNATFIVIRYHQLEGGNASNETKEMPVSDALL